MPYRKTPLVNNEYYHIYNRGVARQPTYAVKKDYERFLTSLSYYRFNDIPFKLSRILQLPPDQRGEILTNLESEDNKRVTLISYALMPNHFHILLRQNTDGGISTFMKHLMDSYTRYFNTRHDRVGPVYQGAFKAVRIETDEQLLHISRYIHLNPLVSFIINEKDFLSYPWSSMQAFANEDSSLVDIQEILAHFSSSDDYLKFVMDQADYGRELAKIRHLTLER